MVDDLRTAVEATGPLGPVAFLIAYALLTVALVPGTIPSLAAGALFGPVWGSVLTIAGATAGAVGAFEIARRIGRDRTRRLTGDRVLQADAWLGGRGISGVVALRLLPVLPFNALNYAFGLSSVGRRDHVLGTVVGIIPGSVAFVALGNSIADPGSTGFLLSLSAVAALAAASAARTRRRAAGTATEG
ncbi:MAG: TVP38/TMEM64 family protein [Candidatus Nanopelagicales bacterium]